MATMTVGQMLDKAEREGLMVATNAETWDPGQLREEIMANPANPYGSAGDAELAEDVDVTPGDPDLGVAYIARRIEPTGYVTGGEAAYRLVYPKVP